MGSCVVQTTPLVSFALPLRTPFPPGHTRIRRGLRLAQASAAFIQGALSTAPPATPIHSINCLRSIFIVPVGLLILLHASLIRPYELCRRVPLDAHTSHALPLRPMTNSANPLTRRTLLHTSALAAAASLLPAASKAQNPASTSYAPSTLKPPTPDADLPVRLGIASYTFRNFDSQHLLIDFMKQLNTPLLNLKSVHLPMTSQDLIVTPPRTPPQPGQAVKDVHPIMIPLDLVAAEAAAYRAAGFILTAAGNITFALNTDEDIRPKFEYLKAAGIPIAVCAPTHENLPRLERFVKEYNIKLAIHNHGPEDKNFPSPFDVLAAVKNLDPRIGLCIDLGHALRAGADVVAAIHAAGPRLYDIHIKDLADATAKESQVAVGEGVMPIRAIFQALIDTHYAGNVNLEYEIHADNPMPGVVESFAYMRGVLAGMGYKCAPTSLRRSHISLLRCRFPLPHESGWPILCSLIAKGGVSSIARPFSLPHR